jgi:hypothetical protein
MIIVTLLDRRRNAVTITVISRVTFGGVVQAPARPDEDTRDGFTHRAGLIDGYLLTITVLMLGEGRRLFPAGFPDPKVALRSPKPPRPR